MLSRMIVRRADTLGMCSGVRRALALVDRALDENPGIPVASLGPLVHNPSVVAEYLARGVTPVEDPSELTAGILVLRTHGVAPLVRASFEKPGLRIVDATCPRVRRIHDRVVDRGAKGFTIVIAGDPAHDEVRGIAGHARNPVIIGTAGEAEEARIAMPAFVVGQTTLARDAYRRICAVLRRRFPGIVIADTTCPSTERRRESAVRLAAEVDAVLVIGGTASANTRWLFEAARSTGRPSWLIESASELPDGIEGYRRVGITAGASTPDRLVDEVEAALAARAERATGAGR
jgi:4-hydroxy-3-methylbut-2-enyl diphosphate reductase